MLGLVQQEAVDQVEQAVESLHIYYYLWESGMICGWYLLFDAGDEGNKGEYESGHWTDRILQVVASIKHRHAE